MKEVFKSKKISIILSIFIVIIIAAGGFWQYQRAVTVEANGVVSIDIKPGALQQVGAENVYKEPELRSKGGNIYEVNYTDGKITIGDDSKGSYEASINITRWNDEASIKLVPEFITAAANPAADLTNKSVKTASTDVSIEYKTTSLIKEFNEYGGLDMIITLKSPPKSPISFTYDSAAVVPYPQPSLAEYKDGYSEEFRTEIKAADTEVTDAKTGKILLSRPEYVINSIAFYADGKANYTTGNTNYKTGKVGHLYRMKASDSSTASKSAWLDWQLTDAKTITMADTTGFLKTAVYPVTVSPVGDTFGYTCVGTTTIYWGANDLVSTIPYTASAGGTGNSISFYALGDPSNFKGVLITHSNQNIVTNGIGNAVSVGGTFNWYTSSFGASPTIANGTDYCFGFIGDSANELVKCDSGTMPYHYDESNSYSSPTNPTDAYHGSNYLYSIYCTYTTGSSPNISNTPSSANLGPVQPGAVIPSGLSTFTVTNNSGSAVNITISGTDITGGSTWTLSDEGTPGTSIAGIQAGLVGDQDYNIIVKKTAPFNTLKSNLAGGASQSWGFRFLAPTNYTDAAQKTGTITLTATTP